MIMVCIIRYYLKSSKTYFNALTRTHVLETLVEMSDRLPEMSDPSYNNVHMIMISLLVVFMPVAL